MAVPGPREAPFPIGEREPVRGSRALLWTPAVELLEAWRYSRHRCRNALSGAENLTRTPIYALGTGDRVRIERRRGYAERSLRPCRTHGYSHLHERDRDRSHAPIPSRL